MLFGKMPTFVQTITSLSHLSIQRQGQENQCRLITNTQYVQDLCGWITNYRKSQRGIIRVLCVQPRNSRICSTEKGTQVSIFITICACLYGHSSQPVRTRFVTWRVQVQICTFHVSAVVPEVKYTLEHKVHSITIKIFPCLCCCD